MAVWRSEAGDDHWQHWPAGNASTKRRHGLAPGPRAVVGRAVIPKKESDA